LSHCGDLRIVRELHWQFFLLLHPQDRCGLFDPFDDFPSTTNNVKDLDWEFPRISLKMKDFSRISLEFSFFLGCFVMLVVSFNSRVLFAKKKIITEKYLGVVSDLLPPFQIN
jgi:hypothetical protein